MLAIPTVFDLIATVLMNVGLLSVTASVYQMMRGAEMLFAALFAVLFLKRHLNKFHYGGILCCVVRSPPYSLAALYDLHPDPLLRCMISTLILLLRCMISTLVVCCVVRSPP